MKTNITLMARTGLFILLFLTWTVTRAQCADSSPTGDCDNDGITNGIDLDDDNDGILDTEENPCNAVFSWRIQNPIFTQTGPSPGDGEVTIEVVEDPSGIALGRITLTYYGFTREPLIHLGASDGEIAFNLDYNLPDTTNHPFGYAVSLENLDFPTMTHALQGSNITGESTSRVEGGAFIYTHNLSSNPKVSKVNEVHTYTSNDSPIQVNDTFPSGTAITRVFDNTSNNHLDVNFGLLNEESYAIGAIYDNASGEGTETTTFIIKGIINAGTGCNTTTDTDNDGIFDHLDLDSDNDGCFDALEGALGLSESSVDAEGRLTGGVDANGVPTVVGSSGQEAGGSKNDLITAQACIVDTDGDGVSDSLDDYPEDPSKAFNSYYPSQDGIATVAFEDLWPFIGDYDFNDTAVDFKVTTVQNASNAYVGYIISATLSNNGGAFTNGFAYEIEGLSPAQVSAVSGQELTEGIFSLNANGTEQGQGNAVIPIFDNDAAVLGETITVTIELASPVSSLPLESMAPFNPFIVIDGQREMEVHLIGDGATDLGNATPTVVGTNADSNGDYRSDTGLPWAILITESIPLPLEKTPINESFVHFNEWVESGGSSKSDWYRNKAGYRVSSKLKVQQ